MVRIKTLSQSLSQNLLSGEERSASTMIDSEDCGNYIASELIQPGGGQAPVPHARRKIFTKVRPQNLVERQCECGEEAVASVSAL